ncbi:Norsolorinic acid reductase A [Lachnellula hyalina]|uniref:Norsolorinic acid reductase A n=1 Tax=Lachnellula hyalina TaxID=1316788 RepID=A0A8H8QU26_9HELO|nr:Norsolorinic acid reductase A [Lachnellula hyalina]TVY22653.1 Norsolorinic acid reductase A [Lachnellula hyalina]
MEAIIKPAPQPKTALGRYRMLSPTAAVRVSPLCLGAMNFGDAWTAWLGACDQKTTESILDFFYESGGNFVDTANHYQAGQSEQWIGEWMKKRGVRDQIVLATKYSSAFRIGHGHEEIIANTVGNGSKSLRVSLENSLKNLQTSYVDLLWVHYWDFTCSIPEMMNSLNDTITSGKVIYIGASDIPAWIVSKANQYARDHGLRQFSVYQGRWSAADRDFEREIIPMTISENMGIAPWGSLGGGKFKTEEQRKANQGRNIGEVDENSIKVSRALEVIAKKKNTLITSVALAYVMHKVPYVFPIVGGRSLEHLKGNIQALNLVLEKEDIDYIEAAAPFDIGFPLSMIGRGPEESIWEDLGAHVDHVELLKPIVPHN